MSHACARMSYVVTAHFDNETTKETAQQLCMTSVNETSCNTKLKVIIVLNNKEAPTHDTTDTCSCDCGVRARCPVYQMFHTNRGMSENNNAHKMLEPTRKRYCDKTNQTKEKVTTNSV